jgi:hypothetical protein
MASCAKSRGQVGGVGGWPVWLRHGRFQSGWGRIGVPRGRVGARQCRARVSPRRRLDAVQACVLSGTGRGVVARERLHALDGTLASDWHGRGATHGRARAKMARGIGPGGRRGAGGKVTSRGKVGVVLSVLGAHGSHGGVLGERGVAGLHRCGVGSGEGVSRDGISPLGVGAGGGGRREG